MWQGMALLAAVAAAGPARAQDALDLAVERARAAWSAHDVQALLATSDTVRLQIPDVAASNALRPGQAARLLERYLATAEERSFQLVELRRLADDHAYAEVARDYVVRGTDEDRREMVFLGFRRVDGVWRLREVRVTP
jgi:hypothetical protein